MASYSQLKSDISDWLWRDDAELLNKIPTLILMNENRMNRKLRITEMMRHAEFQGQGSRFIPLPGGGESEDPYLEMRALRLKSEAEPTWDDQLIQVSPEGLRISLRSKPSRYTIHREIELDSALATGYFLDMVYYTPFTKLSDENTTNWLLENAYDGYLYGSLTEAEPFLRNDERLPIWSSRWGTVMDELEEADKRARKNQSEVRQMPDPMELTP